MRAIASGRTSVTTPAVPAEPSSVVTVTLPAIRFATSSPNSRVAVDAPMTNSTWEPAASSVRAVLSWSYLRLSPEAARLFRFLGLHPGPEITAPAASALADIAPAKAATLLAELAAMNLLAENGDPGRYAMHSLLQAFAAELIAEDATPDDRRTAVHRLHDYHLRAAIAADHSYTTLPVRVSADGVRLPAGLTEPVFPDGNSGLDWSAAEQSVLAALINHAADGFDDHVWRLVAASSCGLMIRGRFPEAARQGRLALAAARRLGDRAAEGKALFVIGRALAYTGEPLTARYQLERALRIQRSFGDRAGQAETHRTLATCYRKLGEPDRALWHAEEYLAAAQDIGHELSVCTAMDVVGSALVALGRHREARDWCERALAQARRLGRRRNESIIMETLGHIHRKLGDLDAAYELYQAATRLCEHGDIASEFYGELELADAYAAAGSLDRAREIWAFVVAHAKHSPSLVEQAQARLVATASALTPAAELEPAVG